MRAFKAGELDVLVATTVIEVGVDVPAATVMVIHDAERFGLAQLHQLRGRVGRGGGAAHCLLLSQGANGEDASRRLDAMVATHDGFRIAEEDLALRGPGELLGPKQAGVPRLRFGEPRSSTPSCCSRPAGTPRRCSTTIRRWRDRPTRRCDGRWSAAWRRPSTAPRAAESGRRATRGTARAPRPAAAQ